MKTDVKVATQDVLYADRFKAIIDSAFDGIIAIDNNQQIKFANYSAEQIFGYNPLAGKSLSSLIPDRFKGTHGNHIQQFITSDSKSKHMQMRSEVYGLHASGEEIPLEITIAKISTCGVEECVALIRDATDRQLLISELKYKASIDALTNLYNRHHFLPLLKKEFDRAIRYEKSMAVLFIDIDHFKAFNDNFGHALGDEVLKQVSQALSASLRNADTLARWGGEEFVVLAPEIYVPEIANMAERLRRGIASLEVNNKGSALSITATIGGTYNCEGDTDSLTLIDRADHNMLLGKEQGRNRVIVNWPQLLIPSWG